MTDKLDFLASTNPVYDVSRGNDFLDCLEDLRITRVEVNAVSQCVSFEYRLGGGTGLTLSPYLASPP